MGDGTKENPYTREDVLRLIEENGGKAKGLDLSGKMFEDKVDLSDLDLSGIKLDRARLFRANFNGSNLDRVTMNRTNLRYANFNPLNSKAASLQNIDLRGANLDNAEFMEADLTATQFQETQFQGDVQPTELGLRKILESLPAVLDRTDFRRANLFLANFKGCYFYGTKLEGAFIRGADILEAHLEEVDWGNYKIGEESKKEELHFAENIYRQLKLWYQEHGMYDIAGEFFFREMTAKRKALKWWSNPFPRAWSKFLSLICGYGERPTRVIGWAASVVLGLAAAYYFWGSFSSSSFWDTLYYSVASFTALGYGQWAPQPTGWAKGMGAAEAFIGVFTMALFIVTFVRKMTR